MHAYLLQNLVNLCDLGLEHRDCAKRALSTFDGPLDDDARLALAVLEPESIFAVGKGVIHHVVGLSKEPEVKSFYFDFQS
jgi:hypothetical protein